MNSKEADSAMAAISQRTLSIFLGLAISLGVVFVVAIMAAFVLYLGRI